MHVTATELASFFDGQTLRLTEGGIWVPLPMDVLDTVLDALDVGPGDVVLDAGMGDGRIVAGLSSRAIDAIGIEIDEGLTRDAVSNLRSLEARGLPATYRVGRGDFLELSTYESLDITPAQVDIFVHYADGNEQALASFIRAHGQPDAQLALVTADLTLTVSDLALIQEAAIERGAGAPPFRLILYRKS